ncbi:MAG TPA: carboxypeptidase-like regulatory domain-containing protein, partial [Gemmatimonadota bacterium]|nr:carboxypeptidase-like regulatory domain-containing protein [Gemmatimonadota bacterium]
MRTLRSPSSIVTTLAVAVAALVLAGPVRAQQQATVRGTVTDQAGAAVTSASVRVVGTQKGAIVDESGHFALTLAPGTYRIEARALGYRRTVQSVTLQAGESRTVDFVLEVSAVQLDEVVASVTAGQTSRREIGTDIATIDAAQQVEEGAVTNFSQLLHGRATN